MANTRWLLISLVVVLTVTSTLSASTIKGRPSRRGAAVKQARPIVQHYYPPLHGPYRNVQPEYQQQQGGKLSTKQIQQWQIAVNVPPGASITQQGPAPPSAPAPGHIWIQVPVAGYPQGPIRTEEPAAPAAPAEQAPAAPAESPSAPAESPSAPAESPSAPAESPSAPAESPSAPAEQPVPEAPPAGEEENSGNEIETVPGEPAPGAIDTDPEKLKHCQEPRGQFPSPTECNKFYNCWDGYVAEQACPGELLFSDQGPFCDYPENVDCSERGGVPPPPPPPATGAPEGGEESEEGSNGLAPGNETGAGGGDEDEMGEEEQVSEEEMAEDVGEGCVEPYSRYRSPKNCGVFIVCDNGRPVRFRCPPTLHYNEGLGICDYPYRVDCGTSAPAPQEEETPDQEQQVPEEERRKFPSSTPRLSHMALQDKNGR
ncbi:hypothetical protein B566_EDAN006075 [Ephemera danica]|nr:hypothetical protein B566_EDAN006075 [Ephemera danica]